MPGQQLGAGPAGHEDAVAEPEPRLVRGVEPVELLGEVAPRRLVRRAVSAAVASSP